jgi:hypothetical protein
MVEKIRENCLVPLHLTIDGPGVGIEQQLGRITTMSFFGFPWAVNAKTVALAGSHVGQIAVPAKAGYLRQIASCLIPLFVEQAKFHSLGDL